ncbi:MAG: 4-alpha-glucanotransferase [Terriglobia bacterium]
MGELLVSLLRFSFLGSYNSQVKFRRSSGILLHPTSLPGRFGIGDLGPEAFQFVDFLHATKQSYWQLLPLGPTGYGDSPYQTFSAFAGNPLLISLERLLSSGLLSQLDLQDMPVWSSSRVDFGAIKSWKLPLLVKAFEIFRVHASTSQRDLFHAFCANNAFWLDDFALFMAVKQAHGGNGWNEWEPAIARRDVTAVESWREKLAGEIESEKFSQFLFFHQWQELKQYGHDRSVKIMGDIPIFVSRDSSDVWAHPELFHLDQEGNPTVVAGVPPDYFSTTGQLWGNPLYRWEVMGATHYQWWLERFRTSLKLFDVFRLDHFRGFEAYWEIPASEKTAVNGRWVKGPGAALFDAMRGSLGELPIVAENLGVITPEVVELMEQYHFPGMAVLQFAFNGASPTSSFLPHNYIRNQLVYTGTHDNNTTLGWWTDTGAEETTRSLEEIREEHEFVLKYLATDETEIHWKMIRAVLGSVADLAIIPLQDYLGLGGEARMNFPSKAEGNWRWRYSRELITPQIIDRIREMTLLYGRAPEQESPS